MLEYSTKPHQIAGREYTTVLGALKYRPSLHLPVSTNEDLLTTSLSKRGASDQSSSNGRTLKPNNRSSALDDCHPPETQPMTVNLTVSTSECAPPALTFPLSRETSISMNICGQVVTYDLKSLGLNPQVIIELLKATKSECATWMIVSAFYRRRGEPSNGISVMKSFIEARGVQADPEELRPAFLLLSGCETDLVRLAKTKKEPESVIRGHYAAAQGYLQKVFGRADHLQNAERNHNYFREKKLSGSPSQPNARMKVTRGFSPQPNLNSPDQETRFLREVHDDQETELAQLRTLKRKLEDDYFYERSMRRKYQRQLDDLEKECDFARKMERYALDQIKREVATRRKAEEAAELERKMRQELIQISDKQFASFNDIINLCEKKKGAEDISPQPVVQLN